MIEVLRCGVLTTIQDLGRHGYRHLGVSQAGALDAVAMQQANLLLANDCNAAVLEISVAPLTLLFHQACCIALAGTDFHAVRGPSTNATPHAELSGSQQQKGVARRLSSANRPGAVHPGNVIRLEAGELLTLQRPAVPGARCYLAIAGGIQAASVMGSRSTDLNACFGGIEGRALQAGDRLTIGIPSAHMSADGRGVRPWSPSHILRAVQGPEHDGFTETSRTQFWSHPWRVSHQSNRMGLRLHGTALQMPDTSSLLSAGVLPGDVQVPQSGLPIVLANDAQTIGGYARIATVIQADLWQLAHLPPGTSVYFQQVTQAEAVGAAERQRQYFNRLALALNVRAP